VEEEKVNEDLQTAVLLMILFNIAKKPFDSHLVIFVTLIIYLATIKTTVYFFSLF